MTDIRLQNILDLRDGTLMPWLLKDNGTLDESEELATAVRVALGTDRLADIDEVLPDPDSFDRRGWWGDLETEEIWNGWPIGVKNWLLTRAKISDSFSWEGDTVERARMYTLDAVQPFIDRRIASEVTVTAERVGKERINVFVTLFRGPKIKIVLRFQLLWDEVERS